MMAAPWRQVGGMLLLRKRVPERLKQIAGEGMIKPSSHRRSDLLSQRRPPRARISHAVVTMLPISCSSFQLAVVVQGKDSAPKWPD